MNLKSCSLLLLCLAVPLTQAKSLGASRTPKGVPLEFTCGAREKLPSLPKDTAQDIAEILDSGLSTVQPTICAVSLRNGKSGEALTLSYVMHPAYCGSHGCALIASRKEADGTIRDVGPDLVLNLDIEPTGRQTALRAAPLKSSFPDLLYQGLTISWDGGKYRVH